MASVITRSLCRCLNFTKNFKGHTDTVNEFLISGNFGRSIWYLAPSSARKYKSTSSPNIGCLCGGFHSKSDAAFSNVLATEISGEKERMVNIPVPSHGWSLKQKGTSCQLTKNFNNDRVKVSFNVNNSISSTTDEESYENEEVVAQPDFMVDVKKPSSNLALSFECFYPEDDYEDQDRENIYSIRSVIVYEGKVEETSYVIDTENIDSNLYNHMLKYLEERGVTNDFADELVGIATAVENEEYVNSLERLQKFVSCKPI